MRKPLATATVVDLKRQACRFGFCHVQCVFPLLRSWQEALPGLWRSWGADGPMETCSHHHLFEAKTTGLSGHLMSVEDHKRATAYACNESFKWRLKTWGKQSPTLTLEKMWSTWQVVSKVGLDLSEMCIFDTWHFEPLWSILGQTLK